MFNKVFFAFGGILILFLLLPGESVKGCENDSCDCAIFAEANGLIEAPAKLCSNCGFGNKIDNCVKCGRWVGSSSAPARLCSNCSFGNKANNCVVCGRWVGSSSYTGKLCSNCSFGNKKSQCCKCGRIVQ